MLLPDNTQRNIDNSARNGIIKYINRKYDKKRREVSPMKKVLSIFLTVVILVLPFSFAAGAKEYDSVISITLNDDIAGFDYTAPERIAVITSDNVVFEADGDSSALQINDYAGNVYLDKLRPGRTYTFSYSITPADGFTIPDTLDDTNVNITCADGARVIYYAKAQGAYKDGKPTYSLLLYTQVTVKGTAFQRIIGRILDFILKIKAWSLY